ncbi:MAG: DUF6527 family protein [Acidithiobacillus sp.]
MGIKLRQTDGRVSFLCPGCNSVHTIAVARDETFPNHPIWGWNNSVSAPTFTPSVNSRVGPFPDGSMRICHSFVKDGTIQYLADCTHHLAGQTANLPDYPFEVWDMNG